MTIIGATRTASDTSEVSSILCRFDIETSSNIDNLTLNATGDQESVMTLLSAGTLSRRIGTRFAACVSACYLMEILLALGYLAMGLIVVPLGIVMLVLRLWNYVLRRSSGANSET